MLIRKMSLAAMSILVVCSVLWAAEKELVLAPAKISGVLVNPKVKSPLIGAVLVLQDLKGQPVRNAQGKIIQALTNKKGQFILPLQTVAPGHYILKVVRLKAFKVLVTPQAPRRKQLQLKISFREQQQACAAGQPLSPAVAIAGAAVGAVAAGVGAGFTAEASAHSTSGEDKDPSPDD